jgi:hypothetical protein
MGIHCRNGEGFGSVYQCVESMRVGPVLCLEHDADRSRRSEHTGRWRGTAS